MPRKPCRGFRSGYPALEGAASMVAILRTACFWILAGSSSRLSRPVLLTTSFRLGFVPFNVVYLRDHALDLGDRVGALRTLAGRFLQGTHRPLVFQDLHGLDLSDELEVGVLKPAEYVGVDHEGLAALRPLDDERAPLLDLLEDVGHLAPGLGHAEYIRELQHIRLLSTPMPRSTARASVQQMYINTYILQWF